MYGPQRFCFVPFLTIPIGTIFDNACQVVDRVRRCSLPADHKACSLFSNGTFTCKWSKRNFIVIDTYTGEGGQKRRCHQVRELCDDQMFGYCVSS